MFHRFSLVTLVLTLLLVGCNSDSDSSTSSENARQAAQEGLATLRKMATGPQYGFFGYESESDVGNEDLGEPFAIKTLHFDDLVASTTPTESLIIDDEELLYPVMVRGATISSILIGRMTGDNWQFIETGSADNINQALKMIAAYSFDRKSCYLMDLDEIEMELLGCQRDGSLRLVPLYSSSPSIVVGTEYSFADIADAMKSEVKDSRAEYANMLPPVSDLSAEQFTLPQSQQSAESTKLLNVSLIGQEQDQWCWAATGRMTMLFAGGDAPQQCVQANAVFPSQNTCCQNGNTTVCNNPEYPRYNAWGFNSSTRWANGYENSVNPSWETIKNLISSGQPLAFLWGWNSGGGAHYMVAVGYYEDATTRTVYINDPWPVGSGERKAVRFEKWIGGDNYDNTLKLYIHNITPK